MNAGDRETPAWDVVEAEITRRNAIDHQIATVWHPAARGDVIVTALGNVRVAVGEVAEYQLSTGEKIAL
ncbi:hypothetical protein ABL840_05010 [Variovorax sp. NFACC27]|uniref:hypothetical protein n=1 Tax=unclassified Variovorax TaxID=663243 RepID=UPI000B80C345